MYEWVKTLRVFFIAFIFTILVIAIKYTLHKLGWEPIAQTSLHNAMVSSVIFVMGFVLSATISDYKESERIPAEYASIVENMYEDAKEMSKSYRFDLDRFRRHLIDVLGAFREGTRVKRRSARQEIGELNLTFGEMERAGVPPNFITRLKQQQSTLLRHLYRVNYIQKISFIPSAFFLIISIVVLVIAILLMTKIDPFYGGLAITGVITFIMSYMLMLIRVISVPFRPKGQTRDDISLFLLSEAAAHIAEDPTPTTEKPRRRVDR